MVAIKFLPLAALLSTAIALPRGQPVYNSYEEDDTCEADEPEPKLSVTSAAPLVSTTIPTSSSVLSSAVLTSSTPTLAVVLSVASSVVSNAVQVSSFPTTPAAITSAAAVATSAKASSAVPSAAAAAASSVASTGGNTTYAGVNIAGFDFGCSTDGTCTVSSSQGPLTTLGNGGGDGIGQMKHFSTDRGLNIFRLPVGWQYLTNSNADFATLDSTNFGNYDTLVQGCLATGAQCIIDVHNYARYNGKIIGQDSSAPTNDQFAALWSNIAAKYADNTAVWFGIMNEPHDLDVTAWATTVQTVVTAIRKAATADHKILLPGTQYTSGTAFVSDGSFDALSKVTNSDSTTTNLIFDIHNYLDSDNSGTSTTCTTDNTAGLATLQAKLASSSRQAIMSETGGGSSDSSCLTDVCAEIAYLNKNSEQFIGYVGWAAGSFATSYALSLTPTNNGGTWTDQPLLSCFARK